MIHYEIIIYKLSNIYISNNYTVVENLSPAVIIKKHCKQYNHTLDVI